VSEPQASAGTASTPAAAAEDDLVRVENLVKHFPVSAGGLVRRTVGQVHAVDDVSLSIPRSPESA
jgi:oligopeptide transport system ATP-binding protein